MDAALPSVISRYFELDAARDVGAIVALFADDATVVDEGESRHGRGEIEAWRTGTASRYEYKTELFGGEALGHDRFVLSGRITGNFPGGTADLRWDFTVSDDLIVRLVIAP